MAFLWRKDKEAGKGVAADDELKNEAKMEEVEPKTGISFQLKLDDGKQLGSAGLRTKYALGMNLKIYAYGNFFFFLVTFFICTLCFSLPCLLHMHQK
jgi:hypothetical protein